MNPTDTDYDILLSQVKALQELNAKLITDNGELLRRIEALETEAGVMKAALSERRGLQQWPLRAEMRD